MRLKFLTFTCALCWMIPAVSQTQSSAFGFLELPRSAHEAALGGRSVSVLESDPSLIYSNPAVITEMTGRTIGLNAMTWLAGTTIAGAQFCDLIGERSDYALSARYVSYGVSDETDPSGNECGTFSARDIALAGTYGYRLSDCWSGGVAFRMMYSKYSYYNSFAIAADLGLTYHSPADYFTAGISFTNIGRQTRPFEDIREDVPFNITAGMSLRLAHAPVRITLTLDHLNKWDSEDFFDPEGELSNGDILMRHMMFGADILFTDQFYATLGYNVRNRAELVSGDKKGLAGFNIGAGMNLERIQFSLSFGKYQVSTSSLLLNFAINI